LIYYFVNVPKKSRIRHCTLCHLIWCRIHWNLHTLIITLNLVVNKIWFLYFKYHMRCTFSTVKDPIKFMSSIKWSSTVHTPLYIHFARWILLMIHQKYPKLLCISSIVFFFLSILSNRYNRKIYFVILRNMKIKHFDYV